MSRSPWEKPWMRKEGESRRSTTISRRSSSDPTPCMPGSTWPCHGHAMAIGTPRFRSCGNSSGTGRMTLRHLMHWAMRSWLPEHTTRPLSFCAALQLDPDLFEAHRDLGVVLALRGDREEAIAALRAALRIRPDDPQVKANLAMLMAGPGGGDSARRTAGDPGPALDTARGHRLKVATACRSGDGS